MNRLLYTAVALCLASCAQPQSPDVVHQAAIWQSQAQAEDAGNAVALERLRGEQASALPRAAAASEREARQFGDAVAAQQTAMSRLQPLLQVCLVTKIRDLARVSKAPANQVAGHILSACRPQIEAVARTVEIARITSLGLAADMAARLRPGVTRAVALARLEPRDPTVSHGVGP